MSKKHTFIAGLLLISAAIIIHLLSQDSSSPSALDMDLVDFFSGILFGVGVVLIAQLFIKSKKAV